MAIRRRKKQAEYFFDYTLLFIVLFLLGFGLIMVYSTSSYEASMSASLNYDEAYYLKHQAAATALGLVAMMVVSRIPYHFWEIFALPGYLVSAVLIALVMTPLGITANGATRWLNLGVSVQPAEIAKLCMILFLASFICKMGKGIRSFRGFLLVLMVPVPICIMVWQITDNMSSAIIIFGIAFLMLFVASPEYKRFLLMGAAGIAGAALLVFVIVQFGSVIQRKPDSGMVESGGLCDRNGVPDAAVSVCNRFRRHFRERSGPVHSEAGISAGSTERYDFFHHL